LIIPIRNFFACQFRQTGIPAGGAAGSTGGYDTAQKSKIIFFRFQKIKRYWSPVLRPASLAPLNGAWSYTWQGNQEQWYPADSKTIGQTISEKTGGKATVLSVKGFDKSENFDTARLKSAAATADVIVLCLGENAYAESPGNISDLALPENQMALARVAAATGKTGDTGF